MFLLPQDAAGDAARAAVQGAGLGPYLYVRGLRGGVHAMTDTARLLTALRAVESATLRREI
jgi:hypothetical protein